MRSPGTSQDQHADALRSATRDRAGAVPDHKLERDSGRLAWATPLIAALLMMELALGGANDGVSSGVASFATALVAGFVLYRSPGESRFWGRARVPLCLFGGALLWSALPAVVPVSVRPAADLFGLALAKALATTLLLVAAALLAYRSGSPARLVRWLTIFGIVYILYAAVDAIDWLYDAAHATRYAGTLGNTNAAGIVFAVVALLAGGVVLSPGEEGREGRALRLAALAGCAVALILCAMTGSRSAVLLAVLFGGVMLALRLIRRDGAAPPIGAVAIGAVALLGLVTIVALITPMADRSSYLAADAGLRWDSIRHYAGVAWSSPVWGYGLGSFFEINLQTLTPGTAPIYWNFGAAHNAPIQLVMEAGLPCLALLLIGLAIMARQVFTVRRDWSSVAVLCAIGAIGGSAMIDIALNVPAIAALFAVLVGALWGSALAGHVSLRRASLRRRSVGRPRPQRVAHRHRGSPKDRGQPIVEPTV